MMKILRLWFPVGLLVGPLVSCTFQSEPLQESLEPYYEPPTESRPEQPAKSPTEPVKPDGPRHPSGPSVSQRVQPAAVRYLISEARRNLQEGAYSLAQSNLERAFRLANRDPWVSYYMGQVLLAQNEHAQAEQWALQALSYFDSKEWRSKGQAWELIASCRRQGGDLRGANQAQKQADSFHSQSYE